MAVDGCGACGARGHHFLGLHVACAGTDDLEGDVEVIGLAQEAVGVEQ